MAAAQSALLLACATPGCRRLFRNDGRHAHCCSMCTAGMDIHSRRCRRFDRELHTRRGSAGVQNLLGHGSDGSDTCNVQGCGRLRNHGFDTCCSYCLQTVGRRHSRRCNRAQASTSEAAPAASAGSAHSVDMDPAVAATMTNSIGTITTNMSASSTGMAHGTVLTAWNTGTASSDPADSGPCPADPHCSVGEGPADADVIQVTTDAVQNISFDDMD